MEHVSSNDVLRKELGEDEYMLRFKNHADACQDAKIRVRVANQRKSTTFTIYGIVSSILISQWSRNQADVGTTIISLTGATFIAYAVNRSFNEESEKEEKRFNAELHSIDQSVPENLTLVANNVLEEMEIRSHEKESESPVRRAKRLATSIVKQIGPALGGLFS